MTLSDLIAGILKGMEAKEGEKRGRRRGRVGGDRLGGRWRNVTPPSMYTQKKALFAVFYV